MSRTHKCAQSGLGLTILLGAILVARGSPINLFPDEEEIVVTAGQEIKIRCEAKQSIMWNYTVHPQTELAIADHDIEQRIKIDYWTDPNSDYQYSSQIVVSDASYLDTGYFACSHRGTTDFENFLEAKRIYVYVDDGKHLIAVPESAIAMTILRAVIRLKVTIPCKPSVPWIRLTLEHEGLQVYPSAVSNEVTEGITYNPREGFVIPFVGATDGGDYRCIATHKNNSHHPEEDHHFHLNVMPEANTPPQPIIHRLGNSHVQIGGTFTLTCSAMYPAGGTLSLNWENPDKDGVLIGRIVITEPVRSEEHNGEDYQALRNLTVFNAQDSDAGAYICTAENHQGVSGEAKEYIQIFEENHTFLNLTISVHDIEAVAGLDARWVATVRAHPRAEVIWTNPKGEEMKMEKNVNVTTWGTESILTIDKVELRDSGYYTVRAISGVAEAKENLSLKVKDKPYVAIENSHIFVPKNELHKIKCVAEGYPLAEVTWFFRNCSLPSVCELSFKPIKENNHNKNLLLRDVPDFVKVTSTIQVTALRSGEYKCSAKNVLGAASGVTQFYVMATSEGLDLKGRTEIYVGENLSLKCGITLFNYTRPISWAYQRNESSGMSVIVEKQGGPSIFDSADIYGYYEELYIPKVGLDASGKYFCYATSLSGYKARQSIDVLVRDQVSPILISRSEERLTLEKGQPLVLQCNVTGKPLPYVAWYRDDQQLLPSEKHLLEYGENGVATLKVLFVKQEDSGTYKCLFSSIAGNVEQAMEVEVLDPPMSWWLILIGIILAIIVVILIIVLVVKIKKERRRKAFLALHNLEKFEEGNPESINPEQTLDDQAELLPYNKNSWEFSKDRLKFGKQLGAGAFGRVLEAQAMGIVEGEAKTTVAVKMLKPSPDRLALAALVKELKVMTNLGRHLNVVNLLGAFTRNIDKGELLLIVEYCKFGSVQKYVQRKRKFFVDQIDRRTNRIDLSIVPDRLTRSLSLASQRQGSVTYANIRPDRTTTSESPLIPPDSPLVNFTPSPTARYFPSGLQGQENGATYLPMTPGGLSTGTEDSSGQAVAPWASSYKSAENDSQTLCTNDLLCWSFQIASGMEYLASRKVCHGDLAARNILLAENNIVKICDFGLAREVYRSGLYTKKSDTPMPVKWMAPESIRQCIFSTQSDVWAFGVTLWEIFTLGEMPYAGIEANKKFVESLETGVGLLSMPPYATHDIYHVMKECWLRDPKSRPQFSELKDHIGNLLEQTTKQRRLEVVQGSFGGVDRVTQPALDGRVSQQPSTYVESGYDREREPINLCSGTCLCGGVFPGDICTVDVPLSKPFHQMYMDLNQSYATMNQAQFKDRVDYLMQIANPAFENFQPEEGLISHDYINSPKPHTDVEEDGYLSPKQNSISNAGYMTGLLNANSGGQQSNGAQVFLFPEASAVYKRLSKLEEDPNEFQTLLDSNGGYLEPKKLSHIV